MRRSDITLALCHYAEALHATRTLGSIQSALEWVEERAAPIAPAASIDCVRRFLRIGLWLRRPPARRPPAKSVFATGPALPGPILIVAGEGANPSGRAPPELAMLRRSLARLRGTIVSGGTKTGVSGLVGSLREIRTSAYPRTVGYVPSSRSPRVRALLDRRYDELVESSGEQFSPLESLVSWEQLLGGGHRPRDIRVLGYGGGQIAACEYRIALSFGAHVGLVVGSGRAVDDLLRSTAWRSARRLSRVAPTPRAVGRFIMPRLTAGASRS